MSEKWDTWRRRKKNEVEELLERLRMAISDFEALKVRAMAEPEYRRVVEEQISATKLRIEEIEKKIKKEWETLPFAVLEALLEELEELRVRL